MYRLGLMHYTGSGAPEDKKLAFEYLEKAANLEHAWAAYRLGNFYYEEADSTCKCNTLKVE